MPSSSIAAFQQQGGKKRINGPPPQPTLPAVRHAILELIARPPPQRCPHCENGFATSSGGSKSAKVVLGAARQRALGVVLVQHHKKKPRGNFPGAGLQRNAASIDY